MDLRRHRYRPSSRLSNLGCQRSIQTRPRTPLYIQPDAITRFRKAFRFLQCKLLSCHHFWKLSIVLRRAIHAFESDIIHSASAINLRTILHSTGTHQRRRRRRRRPRLRGSRVRIGQVRQIGAPVCRTSSICLATFSQDCGRKGRGQGEGQVVPVEPGPARKLFLFLAKIICWSAA